MPTLPYKTSTQHDRLRGGKLYPPVSKGEAYEYEKRAHYKAAVQRKQQWPSAIEVINKKD